MFLEAHAKSTPTLLSRQAMRLDVKSEEASTTRGTPAGEERVQFESVHGFVGAYVQGGGIGIDLVRDAIQ